MKKSRKLVKILTVSALMTLMLSTRALADNESQFVPGTYINGMAVGGMTVEEAQSSLENYYSSGYELTLRRKDGEEEVIKGSEIGCQAAMPQGLGEILESQNAGGRISGPAVDNSHTLALNVSYSAEALEAKVRALDCISGSGVVQTANAGISPYQEGQAFTIIPEVKGNSLNLEKTMETVKAAVASGARKVDLYESGCYDQVTVSAQDASLKALCDAMNRYRQMTVTYQFGEQAETLSGETICSWLSVGQDGQLGVSQEGAGAYVAALAAKYDTAGTARTFHTVTGKDVALTGPYGWKIDQAAETKALTELIASTTQSQTREPVYAQTAAARGTDWGATYVEIDLGGQHVYMLQNGTVVWDAPCVTGNVAKNYTTPEGIYSLTYKEKDRILRGAKQADGTYEYESHVDYWMPFNGGIGLHDADWRGSFGGTIYKNSGSHGCVNLPPSKAPALYDLVYKGIPVICYN